MKRTLSAWVPALAYMAVIFMLSSQPSLPTPGWVFGFDKLQHVIAYTGLGILMLRAVLIEPPVRRLPYLQSFVLAALYAASDEYHQSFTGRSPDVRDWLADVIGICIGLILVHVFVRQYRKE